MFIFQPQHLIRRKEKIMQFTVTPMLWKSREGYMTREAAGASLSSDMIMITLR